MKFKPFRVENHVMNLLESFQAINSTLELDEVLNKIIHFALNIVETAEAGYIQMYDETSDTLVVKTSVGFKEDILRFKVKVGESITGKVFRDGNVNLITKSKEIYKRMKDLSKENFNIIDQAHINNKKIKSILSVPVSLGTERIGVMTIHCFEIEDGLSETDLLLLQSFASQAATAIQNAQLHAEVQNSLIEVKETNALLEKQMEIHNHLTKLSLQNKGLYMIIAEINKMLEKNLLFADYLEGTYFPKRMKHIEKRLDDLFLFFMSKTEPAYVSICDKVQIDCYIYPIRSGSLFLGCLITEGATPLSELDRLIIEQAAPIVSLEIMKQRTQTEMMYKKTYETYRSLLKTKNPQQAEIITKELGINNHYFLQTAIIELDGNVDFLTLENEALIFLSLLKEKIVMDNSVLFSYNNKIIFFSSSENNEHEGKIAKIIEGCIHSWNERFTITVRAGISAGYYYPGQAEENHLNAEKALLHLKNQKKTGMLHYKDIGISRFFINHSPEDIQSFLRETFSEIWSKGEQKGELLQTLFSYVQNNRSMNSTAQELHIHTNTLYNRIKKIEEMTGLDFNQYEDYLQVQLAVYLYHSFVERSWLKNKS